MHKYDKQNRVNLTILNYNFLQIVIRFSSVCIQDNHYWESNPAFYIVTNKD